MEFDCATNPLLVRPKWSLSAPTKKGISETIDLQAFIV
jgi:hypothetical protein